MARFVIDSIEHIRLPVPAEDGIRTFHAVEMSRVVDGPVKLPIKNSVLVMALHIAACGSLPIKVGDVLEVNVQSLRADKIE